MRRFINTGTPRSGSQYLANVFKALGIHCGHEQIYNQWRRDYSQMPRWDKTFDGVSGFAAAPVVHRLGTEYFVINQRRDREACINSMQRCGVLATLTVPHLHYHNYIAHYLPELKAIPGHRERLEVFYDRWNELAARRANFIYAVEDLDVPKLSLILRLVKAPARLRDEGLVREALELVPKDTNHEWKGKVFTYADR